MNREIIKYADIRHRLAEFRKHGAPCGQHPGWDCLEPYYRPNRGGLTVITGIPNHGKSKWLDALRINLACSDGWKHATFSPENYPIELYYTALVETYCGTTQDVLPNDVYREGVDFIDEHFHFVYPPEDDCTIDKLLEVFARVCDNFGADSILIDPWNEVEHRRPAWMNETEYVSHALTKIRRFAREREVHAWVVAHPAKIAKDRDGKYPVPTPWDISGSANFRNKPDYCLCIHRPNMLEDWCQIHVQKVRYRNFGKLGMVEMAYDWRSGRYTERGATLFTLPRRIE